MGASADEIDRQIKETRDHMDENLGALEQRTATNAIYYGRIAAVVLGAAAVAGAGFLIYRRMRRPSRREQMQSMLIQALKDLPASLHDGVDSLRGGAGEVSAKLKKPLPSVKIVVNGDEVAQEPGTVESIVRRVAPAMVSTASSALIGRLTRQSPAGGDKESRATMPAYD
jgi:hypothetical protein